MNRRRPTGRRSPCPCRPAARIFFTASSRKAAMVQSPLQPAMRWTKVADQFGAVRRVHHFRVELHGVDAALHRRRWRKGAPADVALTVRKPSGSLVTRSPWLIHTWMALSPFQTPSNSGARPGTSTKARPNSRWWPPRPTPPSCAHGLLAVADAQHGQAELKTFCGARRAANVGHRAGPPERMTPCGFKRVEGRLGPSGTGRSRNRRPLAHAPRDELGDLGCRNRR
jgi:hypothetical protein